MVDTTDSWAIVAHEKGAVCVKPLSTLLEINLMHFMRGDAGWVIIDLRGTMHEANERKREVLRQRKDGVE